MADNSRDKAPERRPDAAVIDRLYETIQSRRGADPEASYTAKLFARGPKRIAKKLGEEAVEVVIEVIRGDREKLAAESADLLYHLVVAWADAKLNPAEVWKILSEREGVSGIAEKRSRQD